MTKKLIAEITPEGFLFRFVRTRPIAGPVSIPFRDWSVAAEEKDLTGVAQLISWVDDEKVTANEEAVLVPHEMVAALDIETARALGLPEPPPFLLDIQHIGTLDRAEFSFRTTWEQAN